MPEADVPRQALEFAFEHELDLSVDRATVPLAPFVFHCLDPDPRIIRAFTDVRKGGWPPRMPLPVVTYHATRREWKIMDGMQRICAAQRAGWKEVPAFVASGETLEALESILREGYYGEDFVEMLARVNAEIADNLRLRDEGRLAGK